ncbi:hypothetical protein NL676_001829 [Syzygium grande]|nr:hypothetical protein NL676_001829 [Syzygium grande]
MASISLPIHGLPGSYLWPRHVECGSGGPPPPRFAGARPIRRHRLGWAASPGRPFRHLLRLQQALPLPFSPPPAPVFLDLTPTAVAAVAPAMAATTDAASLLLPPRYPAPPPIFSSSPFEPEPEPARNRRWPSELSFSCAMSLGFDKIDRVLVGRKLTALDADCVIARGRRYAVSTSTSQC